MLCAPTWRASSQRKEGQVEGVDSKEEKRRGKRDKRQHTLQSSCRKPLFSRYVIWCSRQRRNNVLYLFGLLCVCVIGVHAYYEL